MKGFLSLYNKSKVIVKSKTVELYYTFVWSYKKNSIKVVRERYINDYYSPGSWLELEYKTLEEFEKDLVSSFNESLYWIKGIA